MSHAQKPSVDSEMHELNEEADLFEQKTIIVPGGANGEDTKLQAHNTDPDAQAMVIESLRAQVQDLFSQVSQLNNKLVRSYDRISDLEDELHVSASNHRRATLRISQLELERTQHLSALSTGLLVEKSHVTTELNRLMEKATEEAARRGQAETARQEIEQELDDLSAGLFNQANIMVAEARMSEARSARKLEETETALRGAEEIVGVLQAQMQALQAEKEQADRRVEDMRARMGKGKWVDRSPESGRPHRPRLISSHVPYHEFLVFISHLRAIRPASPQPPAMSTLLPLPLLARLVSEDSDPTVRLDLAPSLNWLSRRSVLAAIHSGQLTVEPMHFANLLEELAPPNIPASSHHTHIVCALCGMPIYSTHSDSPATTPTTPNALRSGSQSASWSTTLFKNVRAGDITLPTAFTGSNRSSVQFGAASSEPPSQVYIFRLEATSSGLPVSLPLSSQGPGTPTRQSTIYPLCTSGWCLGRLRTTCSLWAFVRTSIVEKVWDEPPFTERPSANGAAATKAVTLNGSAEKKPEGAPNGVSPARDGKPAIPPRRSKIGLGSIWGSMQRSLSGTREPETTATANGRPRDTSREDARPKLPPRDPSRKSLPPPPPVHPSIASHAPTKSVGQVHAVPPPLPKRSRGREATATPEPEPKALTLEVPPSETQPSEDAPAPAPAPADQPQPTHKEEQKAPTEETPVEETPAEETPAAAEAPAAAKPDLLVAPPPDFSRSESQDSFATPTEELAPAFTASPAPTAVPLPRSQAPTPVPVPAPQEADADADKGKETAAAPTDDSANEAAPVIAPTPIAAVPSTLLDEKPPSRAASPVPPPLPRRAAARARPSSVSVPQAVDAPKETAPQETAPASTAPVDGAAPAPVVEEPEPIVPEGEKTDVVAPTEDAAHAEVTPDEQEKAHESWVNVDNASLESQSESEAHPSPEKYEEDVKVEPEVPEVSEEKADDGQYVGEATWEERTYRELVRLREEMFWARVGAVVH
ncbi:hypothetical protein C2E23DRAFT_903704 [Lenzites betulinus]|nr:hypothetical protein C2E23DRAFT_903704 [Lenzites betulinus]